MGTMIRRVQFDDEDLPRRLAKARHRARVALAERLDRVSRLMEERCIAEHRLAVARMKDDA